MKHGSWKLILGALAFGSLLAGCATIISGTKQNISISSTPSSASVDVRTMGGLPVFSGTTPTSCKLPRKDEYLVTIKLAGYNESKIAIGKSFNEWAIGNLLCGGIIGIILDAVDGAMWKLEPGTIHIELVKAVSNGRTTTYAVIGALDDEGQLRTIAIPMLPINN